MDNPLQNGMNGVEQHPPREQLLLYVDRELTPKGAAQIETHLGACWSCRARVSKIEKFIADFMEFDGAMLTPRLSPPPNSWCLVHSEGSFPGRAVLSCRVTESGLP
jgi:predicted anti-sigma-YlaC factor YlaD